jgi:AraC-like DNA-binding protein
MYPESISFDDQSPVMMNVYHIDEYPLHCHEDAIEIIFVLKGAVQVKASFEFFTLNEGDYVVVNREDSHKIWRYNATDNLVAIFQISLKWYRASFPYIDYVIFTCESFDLAKYKGQADQLRRLLLQLTDSLSRCGRKSGRTAQAITARLMQTLVREYSLEQYYNRSGEISADKLETYYTIIKYIYEQYHNKNILQEIASREFYSKSYISHLFKEVGAASFQDILGYIRVYKAERLLLETDCGIANIAEKCGFSDSKYFNRTFQKWFLMKPSEYRKIYQTEIGKDIKASKAAGNEVATGIRHLSNLTDDSTECKVSMTPITLKNIGSRTDLLHCLKQERTLTATGDGAGEEHSGSAYAIIRIGDDGNPEETKRLLEKMLRDLKSRVPGDIEYWFVK